MKAPSVRFGFFVVIISVLVVTLVISSVFGAGYIMVVWLGWQIQASASLLIIIFLLLVMALAYLLTWGRQYKIKKDIHLRQCPDSVLNLNWFEQLGCYWLLEAKLSKQTEIQTIFNQSGLLKNLIDARLNREAGEFELARQALLQTPEAIKPLADIELVKILIAEQNYDLAVQHLHLSNAHENSAFMQSLEPAYHDQIAALWQSLALRFPWRVAYEQTDIHLINDSAVLQALATEVAQARDEHIQHLLGLYDAWRDTQPSVDVLLNSTSNKSTLGKNWLALLLVIPQAELQFEKLSEQLLAAQFEPALFECWLQQQVQQGKIADPAIQQRIFDYAYKYPAQPIIAYAIWQVYQANHDIDSAQNLLMQWPQDTKFCYLRLRQSLLDQPQLLQDLEILYNAVKR
jgi:hypothetical protein